MGDYINVKEIFGCDVFNDSVMQDRLPKKVYRELKKTIEEGKELSMEIADVVAHEMKEWAIEKGDSTHRIACIRHTTQKQQKISHLSNCDGKQQK